MQTPNSPLPPMHPSIYRLRLHDILTLCVLGLLFLGIIMVQSAAMNLNGDLRWHWNDRGMWHIIYAAIALLTFFIVGHVDYSILVRGRWHTSPVFWVMFAAIAACVLVLVPGIGREVNGARRWIRLGFTQIQPSELGKWAAVLFLARWFSKRSIDVERLGGLLMTLAPIGIICVLIVKEDFGTAALIGACTLAMCLAGRARLWHLALLIPPAVAGGLFAIMHKAYRVKRLMAFTDPFASPEGDGYHMIQSLLSFATGGIFGTGLGQGVQKLGYLPEDTTDFIFAVICEELGLAGALLTIALYLGILFVAWQVIRQKKDSLGQLLAFGIGSMIGLQALINIAVATVSIPPKGMSLPLVSAGGTGLVITCAALGLLYNVARQVEIEQATESTATSSAQTPPVETADVEAAAA